MGTDTEWRYVAFDITYNIQKTNMLHLEMHMGWTPCGGNAKKVECCVKECVGDAFGIKVDNG